jgi:LacI family transcriptional regulator
MANLINHKKPTVLEIAQRAKVSRAAVYAVLNAEKPTNIGISQEKRERILSVANQLGYVRNELARSLVTGKTFSIGVLVHSLRSRFYTDFFTSLEDVCYNHGYSVFITSSEFNADREARNLRAFLSKRVDAVIIARGEPGVNDDIIEQIVSQGIPVALLGEVDVPNLPYSAVGFDESMVGELASSYLWSMGHRHVLYFNAGKTKDSSLRIHQVRRENFARTWQKISQGHELRTYESTDPIHGGNELAEQLENMSLNDRPTGIVCSTDRLAISLISALQTRKFRVPDDISIMGCDDVEAAAEAVVPLTTIRLPVDKLAQNTWTMLQRFIDRKHDSIGENQSRRLIVHPELVIRQSVRVLK